MQTFVSFPPFSSGGFQCCVNGVFRGICLRISCEASPRVYISILDASLSLSLVIHWLKLADGVSHLGRSSIGIAAITNSFLDFCLIFFFPWVPHSKDAVELLLEWCPDLWRLSFWLWPWLDEAWRDFLRLVDSLAGRPWTIPLRASMPPLTEKFRQTMNALMAAFS